MAKSKRIHQMTIPEWEAAFPDEDACCAYLVGNRWPQGVACPRCGSTKVGELKANPWHWQCYDCGQPTSYRFSHITGTIFENTNKPLRNWFRVIHTMLTSKKGVSALQIKRVMGFGSYKTAWYMCHRVRVALQDQDFRKLIGEVEVDETYVGGKNKNRHGGGKGSGTPGPRGSAGKTPIVGAVQRKGNVVARVLDNVRGPTLQGFVREVVSNKVSLLATDDFPAYAKLAGEYPHFFVKHSAREYVAGAIHTNTIEGFWSLIKRGIVGNYHKVSKKYVPLYVAEFYFRYNNRENDDIFGEAIRGC